MLKSALDVARSLKELDDESIKTALELIETSDISEEPWLPAALLCGRGGINYWSRIKPWLQTNLNAKSISLLANYLPISEFRDLIDHVDFDDSSFLNAVRDKNFPPFQLMPEERQHKFFVDLVQLLDHETDTDSIATIFLFLFRFEEHTANSAVGEEVVIRASKWCLDCPDETKVTPVLRKLLWKAPSPALIKLADSILEKCAWTRSEIFLLTGFMRTGKTRDITRHVRSFFSSTNPTTIDGYVVSRWIRATKCSRESLALGRDALRFNYALSHDVLFSLFQFSRRRRLARWLSRFLDTEFCKAGNGYKFPIEILYHNPSKRNISFAVQVFDFVGLETQHELLLELVQCTNDKRFVDLAKIHIENNPNAEHSYKLMCGIARNERELAIPWIATWIKTASTDQIAAGLAVILRIAPTAEFVQMARSLASESAGTDPTIKDKVLISLMVALLQVAPSEELVQQAKNLLDKCAGRFPLFSIGLLASRVRKLTTAPSSRNVRLVKKP